MATGWHSMPPVAGTFLIDYSFHGFYLHISMASDYLMDVNLIFDVMVATEIASGNLLDVINSLME